MFEENLVERFSFSVRECRTANKDKAEYKSEHSRQDEEMLRENLRSLVMPIKQRFATKQVLPQSLADLLVNPVQLGHFRRFLQTEFSQENLDFILDVDKLLGSYDHEQVRHTDIYSLLTHFRRSEHIKNMFDLELKMKSIYQPAKEMR